MPAHVRDTRRAWLDDAAVRAGLHVRTYSPGDGTTRYRFFTDPANTYFGPGDGIATVLGISAAEEFISAYAAGRAARDSAKVQP